MKLTSWEWFEIRAALFKSDTGITAPGKDVPMHSYEPAYACEERQKAFDLWWSENMKTISATLRAVEKICEREGDEE